MDKPCEFSKKYIEFQEGLKSEISINYSIDGDWDKQESIESKSQVDSIGKSQNSQVPVEEAFSQAFSQDANSDSGSSRDIDVILPIPQLGIVKIPKSRRRASKYNTVIGPTDLGKHSSPNPPKKRTVYATIGKHLSPPFENRKEVFRPKMIQLGDPNEKSFDNRK